MNLNKPKGKVHISILVLLLLLPVLVLALYLMKDSLLPVRPTLPVMGNVGGDFELTSTLNKPTKLSDFRGSVVFVNFGFTHCPDFCPLVLDRLVKITANAKSQLNIDHPYLQTLFISVDPARDTTEQLKKYLEFYNPNFVGFTGSIEGVDKVAKQFGVFYKIEPSQSGSDDYNVSHSDQIFLLDKKGMLRMLIKPDTPDQDIADAILALHSEGE